MSCPYDEEEHDVYDLVSENVDRPHKFYQSHLCRSAFTAEKLSQNTPNKRKAKARKERQAMKKTKFHFDEPSKPNKKRKASEFQN